MGKEIRCQHILVSHFTCTPHGDLVWLLSPPFVETDVIFIYFCIGQSRRLVHFGSVNNPITIITLISTISSPRCVYVVLGNRTRGHKGRHWCIHWQLYFYFDWGTCYVSTWNSLVEGDERCISPSGKLLCSLQPPRPKNYAAHARQNSILVWLLGRSGCSSPFTKLHGLHLCRYIA